jgi:hypothetical protein
MPHYRYCGSPRRDFLEPLGCTLATPPFVGLVGPLPLYAVVRPSLLRHLGWSVLVMNGQRPFAMVDAGWTRGGRRFHAVHSQAAAVSLHDALLEMRRHIFRPEDLRLLTSQCWRDTCVAGPGQRPIVAPLYGREVAGGRRGGLVTFDRWYAVLGRKRRRMTDSLPHQTAIETGAIE